MRDQVRIAVNVDGFELKPVASLLLLKALPRDLAKVTARACVKENADRLAPRRLSPPRAKPRE